MVADTRNGGAVGSNKELTENKNNKKNEMQGTENLSYQISSQTIIWFLGYKKMYNGDMIYDSLYCE